MLVRTYADRILSWGYSLNNFSFFGFKDMELLYTEGLIAWNGL
ncbi:MAG: hypothetical protein ACLVHH_10730 [Faecalibacillus intestinalis]